ncbi:MAG: ATP-binding protein [Pedobacter sp.]|jgi:hypothetical protein|uniref:ATP-binding protein n=1 Tax=Pedobacter sp. TaxID=1411316 RepID=UPI003566B041
MKLTRHDIGGELISIITKGMYADPKDALREYVQNGVDAMAETISIKIRHNNISITDDGHGMDKIIMRKAIRVGISDKNPKKSVGFMGIGIYSSLHLCEKLCIYSKTKDEKPHQLTINFAEIRFDLENQKDSKIESSTELEQQIDLQTLLENNIEFTELDEFEFPKTGTRIEMLGLDSNFFGSLSKYDEVAEYLERVVPLPFSPDFMHGAKIQKYITEICKKNNALFRTIDLLLDINGNEQKLYRPYKDSDFRDKAHPDDAPLEPKFYELNSAEGFMGLAWGCLNNGRRTIPNGKVRGFIIKKHGFTIGKREDLIIHYGRPTYFNRYVGEFIAVHPKLLPNGPRTDFEHSSIRTTFYGVLQQTANRFNKVADEYQEHQKAEEDLFSAIEKYNEITAQIEFFQDNGDKLLDFFQTLNTINISLKKKLDAEKLKGANIEKAHEAIKGINGLLDDIKSYLDIKKNKKKKATVANNANTIAKIITPNSVKPSEPAAESLIEVIQMIGLELSSDLKTIIDIIDEKFIKTQSSSREDYVKKLNELREDIEEIYESE